MLPGVFVDLERLENIGKDLVIDFPAFLVGRLDLVVVCVMVTIILGFTRVPATVLEADTHTGARTNSQQEVMDEVGRYVFRVVVLRNCAIIQL